MKKWLIYEWQSFMKFATTWAVIVAAGLQEAVQEWPNFPDDLKQYLPHILVKILAWSSFPAIVLARIIRQKSIGKT